MIVLLIVGAALLFGSATTSILPLVIPDSIPAGSRQGSTGTKVFMATGSFTNGNAVISDSNGNAADGGALPASVLPALFVSTADATITNTGTTLIGTGVGSLTIPANYFAAGTILHIFASGVYSTAAVPGSLQMSVTLGGTNVLGAGAFTPIAGANTVPWNLNTYLVCRTAGAMGTIGGQGIAIFTNSTTSALNAAPLGNNSTTFNTTGTLVLNITATWGSFAAGDTITGTNVVIAKI